MSVVLLSIDASVFCLTVPMFIMKMAMVNLILQCKKLFDWIPLLTQALSWNIDLYEASWDQMELQGSDGIINMIGFYEYM